jgi:TPP-dependent pyruvate/acetoin dehydrogenase alpha subunit
METYITKKFLIDFEKQVAKKYEQGLIHSPIHLSSGNEDQLIEIFKDIKRTDLICSTWRSHLHALLHGIHPDELMRQILAGRSMCINSVSPWFYASSIAGGILPVAVGLGMAIKRKREDRHVFCFVGDMAAMMGIFEECTRYARNFELPVTFIVEDNGKSVTTITSESWGVDNFKWGCQRNLLWNCKYYTYELTWPHHGSGKFVNF